MVIFQSSRFNKKVRKLSPKIYRALSERTALFTADPHNSLLDNHALRGEWEGYRSFNVTGDWRVIFEEVGADTVLLTDVDTHHNLYGN